MGVRCQLACWHSSSPRIDRPPGCCTARSETRFGAYLGRLLQGCCGSHSYDGECSECPAHPVPCCMSRACRSLLSIRCRTGSTHCPRGAGVRQTNRTVERRLRLQHRLSHHSADLCPRKAVQPHAPGARSSSTASRERAHRRVRAAEACPRPSPAAQCRQCHSRRSRQAMRFRQPSPCSRHNVLRLRSRHRDRRTD